MAKYVKGKKEVDEEVEIEEDEEVDKPTKGMVLLKRESGIKDLYLMGYVFKSGKKVKVNKEVMEYIQANYPEDFKCM